MKQVRITKFKAECIALLKHVQRSGEPLMITLRGEPLVTVHSAYAEAKRKLLGGQKGVMRVKVDIVQETAASDWEMLKE